MSDLHKGWFVSVFTLKIVRKEGRAILQAIPFPLHIPSPPHAFRKESASEKRRERGLWTMDEAVF